MVRKGEALNLSEYEEDGKDAFRQALESAQAVLADEDATASEITDVTKNLQSAMGGLKPMTVNPPATGSLTLLWSMAIAVISGATAFRLVRRRKRIIL